MHQQQQQELMSIAHQYDEYEINDDHLHHHDDVQRASLEWNKNDDVCNFNVATNNDTNTHLSSTLTESESRHSLSSLSSGTSTMSSKFVHYGTVTCVTIGIVVVFCFCRVGKSVCNLLASKFTASVNTQLVSLAGPFMVTGIVVSFASCQFVLVLYAKKKNPEQKQEVVQFPFDWKMGIAMMVSTVGAILVILGR